MNSAANSECSTTVEAVLAIWHEVLKPGDGRLDADSNFFLCGGDSLDLMRVLVRVRERLGVELDLREVGSFSTPRRMARRCVRSHQPHVAGKPDHVGERTPVTADASVPARFACSTGQRALWYAENLGGGALYNTAVLLHIRGALQVPVLARALGLLLRQHEVLRCRLRPEPPEYRLIAEVVARCDVALEAVNVHPDDVRRILIEAAAQPFDLERGPLWRFHLLQSGERHWTLLFCLHHAVTDGWSGSVLLHHLAEAYKALLLDSDWQPHGIDTEFRRWSLRQRSEADADTSWWRKYLAGADSLASWPPTGATRWPFTMACVEEPLPRPINLAVQQLTRSRQLRPAALFLAALRLALLEVAGIGELCIGMPVNVRDGSAQDAAVGYFVNLVVLREPVGATNERAEDGRWSGHQHGIATVRRIQHALDDALRHRTVPFADLAQALRPALLPSGNAWCDVLYAFQNLPRVQPEFGDVDVRIEALAMPRGQHPLKVEVLCGAGMGQDLNAALNVDSDSNLDAHVGASSCTGVGAVFGKSASTAARATTEAYALRIEYARECLAPADVRALLDAMQCQLAALAAGPACSS